MITWKEFNDIAIACGYHPAVDLDMFRYSEEYAYSYAFYNDGEICVKVWTNPPCMKKIYHESPTTKNEVYECLCEAVRLVDAIEKEKGVKDEG